MVAANAGELVASKIAANPSEDIAIIATLRWRTTETIGRPTTFVIVFLGGENGVTPSASRI